MKKYIKTENYIFLEGGKTKRERERERERERQTFINTISYLPACKGWYTLVILTTTVNTFYTPFTPVSKYFVIKFTTETIFEKNHKISKS